MEVSSPTGSTTNLAAAGTNGMATPPFPSIEPERVVEHLAAVCEIALGATREELEQPGSLLHSSRHAETVSRCTRFATDSQNVLYIQKDIANSSAVDGASDTAGTQQKQVLGCGIWIY